MALLEPCVKGEIMGIGPSTKETSKHHFVDPLIKVISEDRDVNLKGIIVVGTPQSNAEKHYVGERTAVTVANMQVDGCIITTDGFGNSHVDFAHTIEEIGRRDIPIVGMSFVGQQGKFVTTNRYMDTIVDTNKSVEGVETTIVGENSANEIDARKALAMLKLKIRRNNEI